MAKNRESAAVGSVIKAVRKGRLTASEIMALVANRKLVARASVKKEALGYFPNSLHVALAPDGTVCTFDTSLSPDRLTIGVAEAMEGKEIELLAKWPVPAYRLVNKLGGEWLVAAMSTYQKTGPYELIERTSVPHLFQGTSVVGTHILYVKEGMTTIVESLVADHVHGIFDGGRLVCYEKAGDLQLAYIGPTGRVITNWKCKERVLDAAWANEMLVVNLGGTLYRVLGGHRTEIDCDNPELTKIEVNGILPGTLTAWQNLVAGVSPEDMYVIGKENCALLRGVKDASAFPWFSRGTAACVMTGDGTASGILGVCLNDIAFHCDHEGDSVFASWAGHKGDELAWGKKLKRRIVLKPNKKVSTHPDSWCILRHGKLSKLIYVQEASSGRWRVTDGVVNYGKTWTSVLRITKTKNGKGIVYWAFEGRDLFKVTATVFA